MWVKLLLALLYMLLLFFWARLLDVVLWYQQGKAGILSANFILDPLTLSVRQLKQILDNRGISYAAVVEKRELVSFIDSTGNVTETELTEAAEEDEKFTANSIAYSSATSESTHFTCGTHFYEEVEDSKDSVWLVQVVPLDGEPLLDEYTWRKVIMKASRFGVRTGVFRCSLDKRLCSRKGWSTPQLILALPRGNRAKEDVVLHSYVHVAKYQLVLSWIHMRLASHIKMIESVEELNELLNYKSSSQSSDIRVILISLMAEPPLFLSALAIKFTGRIRFGMTKIKKSSLTSYCKSLGLEKLPAYLIATPEKQLTYGNNPGENLNYKSMEIYLKSLRPEMNDLFQFSLWFTNITVGLQLFLYSSKLWKHLLYCFLQFVKYNCCLFLLWLLILGLCKFSLMDMVIDGGLKLSRHLSWTRVATMLRRDFKSLTWMYFSVSYTLYGIALALCWRRWGCTEDRDELSLFSDWWTTQWDNTAVNYFFRPMTSITRPAIALDLADLEEGMELLIERLAVPNLWLQPVVQTDYVKDLPVWQYKKHCTTTYTSVEDDAIRNSAGEESAEASLQSSSVASNFHFSQEQRCSNNSLIALQDSASSSSSTGEAEEHPEVIELPSQPRGMLTVHECAICLESYRSGILLCGLPCGHNYHHSCIMMWLTRDNHCCPVCRWPSFRSKVNLHPHSS